MLIPYNCMVMPYKMFKSDITGGADPMPPWEQDFVLRAPIRGSSKVPLWHAIARKIKEEGDGKKKDPFPTWEKEAGL